MRRAKDKCGIVILTMKWEDSNTFQIPLEDLCQCVWFIEKALQSSSSVLVNCAQVRLAYSSMNIIIYNDIHKETLFYMYYIHYIVVVTIH